MVQKSYEKNGGNLYIVPTPIGNLEDITTRAINVLREVHSIFAEDTRVTLQLLNSLNIKNKIYSAQKFNELKASISINKILSEGKNVALVTDRGTPLISDPGYVVVQNVIKQGYNVIALPGASALLPALNMSGLSSEKFLFYGFLNSKESVAIRELEKLKNIEYTIIFYEAPHRLIRTLNNMKNILGDRQISISREISKVHEEVFRGSVSEAISVYQEVKGECVIVVAGIQKEIDYSELLEEVKELVKNGSSSKDAIREIASKYKASKNILYNMYEEVKK